MKKATLMLAVLAAIGCGDDSGSSIVKSVLDAEDDSTQFYCECFYDSEGYASEAACLTDNLYTNVEKSCIADAYGPVVDFNPSLARCLARVSREAASCIADYGCGVTAEQIDACTAPLDTACGGEVESLCAGLTGTTLSDCQAEEARADAAAEACSP